MNIKDKITTIIGALENNSLDDYQTKDIISILKSADDSYYNLGVSLITDARYDILRNYTKRLHPHDVYFTGLGADVRGGKVKLPYEMGSLDQIEIGDITDWVGDWNLQQQFLILTDKLDGTSGMVIYGEDGKLQIAYSRGNGTRGADITRHLRKMNIPQVVSKPVVIRGELIIRKESFPRIQKVTKTRGGEDYKNARNCVAGLMNSKENPPEAYEYIEFVAYDILDSPAIDKINMLQDLVDEGFSVPAHRNMEGRMLTDNMLSKHIKTRKENGFYEIDGVVIDVNLAVKRDEMNPTRETLNPAYAIKYKTTDASNIQNAIVRNVEWNLSKHGYLKPIVHIEPVDMGGVTIRKLTGFNAKFIIDNQIGQGAEITITRAGEVIPMILKTIKGTTPHMPDKNFTWTTNDQDEEVDIILDNHEQTTEVKIKQMVDFFSAIEAPMLKQGNMEKLFNAGYTTLDSIILADVADLVGILGKNGEKVYNGLRKQLFMGIPLYQFIGAFSTERGIGVRRMKKLQQAFGDDEMLLVNIEDIVEVDGFDLKTATQAFQAISDFLIFYPKVNNVVTFPKTEVTIGGTLVGQKIVMTGFRDKELAALIEAQGGDIQSSISSKTTILIAKNPASTSGKMKKARDLGIRILGIDEFKKELL